MGKPKEKKNRDMPQWTDKRKREFSEKTLDKEAKFIFTYMIQQGPNTNNYLVKADIEELECHDSWEI